LLRLPHPGKQLAFALLSLADLALTWALIQQGMGQVYEANPVAAWWLRNHGWVGLATFKAFAVLSGIGLGAAISRRQPVAGGRILALGCAATAAVVLYSGYLAAASAGPLGELRAVRELEDRFEARQARARVFKRLLTRLAGELADGRCELAGAVAELEPAARTAGTPWPEMLQGLGPDRPTRQCLAVWVINHAVGLRDLDSGAARELGARLADDFRSLFGVPPPLPRDGLAFARTQATVSGDR
jgi:hypothetical protein